MDDDVMPDNSFNNAAANTVSAGLVSSDVKAMEALSPPRVVVKALTATDRSRQFIEGQGGHRH